MILMKSIGIDKVSVFYKYRGIGIGQKLSIDIGLNFGVGTSVITCLAEEPLTTKSTILFSRVLLRILS